MRFQGTCIEGRGMGRSASRARPAYSPPERKDEMTEEQAEIAALGWEVRLAEQDKELWFAVIPEKLPAAHALAEKQWLHRRIGDQPEWRLTDAALYSLRMDSLRRADAPDWN
jgi:hypothetical protein